MSVPRGHPGDRAAQRSGRDRVAARRADRLRDARQLEVEQRAGRLGRAVLRMDAGAAGGQHDVGRGIHDARQRGGDLGVRGDDRVAHGEARVPAAIRRSAGRSCRAGARGRTGRRDEHRRCAAGADQRGFSVRCMVVRFGMLRRGIPNRRVPRPVAVLAAGLLEQADLAEHGRGDQRP